MSPATKKLVREIFVEAAQTRYELWSQDEDGYDEDIGYGGICSIIADEAICYYTEAGYDAWPVSDEEHTWVVVIVDGDAIEVDIPAYVYETGAGYNWTKLPGVIYSAADVTLRACEDVDTVIECAHLM